MEKLSGLSHLFMTIFLHNFSTFMVIPAITDVTMSALCPGRDQCSLAIYLTGFQQAIIGLGTLVTMPLIGNMSDKYGRKVLLTVPMSLMIVPSAILAYGRTRNFFYAYYVARTLIAMLSEGSVHCLALAYVADNVPESRRASTFGILTGIASSAFVCGNLSTRFLSTPSTFQVSASVAIAALVYMRLFLQDSIIDEQLTTPILTYKGIGKGKGKAIEQLTTPILTYKGSGKGKANAGCCANEIPSKDVRVFKSAPSLEDMLCLLKSSVTLSQAAVVAFFYSLAEVGLHASLMYYLKAQFHFSKDQFADLMVISGIAGTVSQLVIMPILTPALGETRLLAVGLFFTCVHVFLYSIAWTFWVPYVAAMFSILFVFSHPCMRSIVSKQVGSCEQGKAQGCISGISSFANVISPLVFSPLTALFLSEGAPFPFPGFSIMCVGFASMIAFIQSLMMRTAPPIANQKVVNTFFVDA
ncbi:MAJOR FACILITATOR SUPERFAMILY DOMAIN-CONTAINING PROTEIN 10 [Salix purpurea]|uniref:MAJOR FACILITATOR SUPERFAMILY DOMAIN-CONTAINING PROTEIN 10 n=1 Tax=Salix purpurea TaxID=77065 RepID=A0A9Q0SPV3_SALPP|nr:MAJOR FACILITATOR SUPERFAMILY DOMAIN-CONTAINING PROTEIN 10 [Salix purpurea]